MQEEPLALMADPHADASTPLIPHRRQLPKWNNLYQILFVIVTVLGVVTSVGSAVKIFMTKFLVSCSNYPTQSACVMEKAFILINLLVFALVDCFATVQYIRGLVSIRQIHEKLRNLDELNTLIEGTSSMTILFWIVFWVRIVACGLSFTLWVIFLPHDELAIVLEASYCICWGFSSSYYISMLITELRNIYTPLRQGLEELVKNKVSAPLPPDFYDKELQKIHAYEYTLKRFCESNGLLFGWPLILAALDIIYWLLVVLGSYKTKDFSIMPETSLQQLIGNGIFILLALLQFLYAASISHCFQEKMVLLNTNYVLHHYGLTSVPPNDNNFIPNDPKYNSVFTLREKGGFQILGVVIQASTFLGVVSIASVVYSVIVALLT